MKSAKWIIILFGLLAIIQLAIPAKMIMNSNNVITQGSTFLFKLKPIDPNDPFRGKYMTLSFEEDTFPIDTCTTIGLTSAYVYIKNDSEGFADIQSVEYNTNLKGSDYIKADVYCDYYGPVNKLKEPKIHINYPFNRFYMNELDISTVENKIRELLRDTTATLYGEVSVYEGQARILSIKTSGKDILDIIQE
jgi:uncharacterized membrane-anchored protein